MSRKQRESVFLAMVGPAGCGKSTFCEMLVTEFYPSLSYFVTYTTRAPRDGEVEGESYHFVSKKVFEDMVSQNLFFEWENVHGNLYGTPRKELQAALEAGTDLVFQIDIRGAASLKAGFPKNTAVIFVTPPSLDVLKERLVSRGSIPSEELKRRLDTAKGEYQHLFDQKNHESSSAVDYLVINCDLDAAYAEVRGILHAERRKINRQYLDNLRFKS